LSVERSVEPLSQLFPEAGRAMPSPETQRRESAAADLRRELRIEGSGLKTNLGTHCSKPPFSTPFEDSGTCHPDLFLDPCVSVFIRGLGIEGEQPSRRLKPVLRTGDGLKPQACPEQQLG
jgi:hypothetical protein